MPLGEDTKSMYYIIYVLTIIFSFLLFKKAAGSLSLKEPNMISISYYYSFLVSSFLTSIFIVHGTDTHYMISKVTNPSVRIIGFWIMVYVMIFTPIIMILASKLVGFEPRKEWARYLKTEVKTYKNSGYDIFVLAGIVSILAVIYTVLKTDAIPIFELLKGNREKLGELRIEASHGFSGNVLFRNIFAKTLLPILSFVAFVYSYSTKEKKWTLWFWGLFVLSCFINAYDLQKSPIFFYLLTLLVVGIYMGKWRLNLRIVFGLGFLGLIAMIGIYVVISGSSNITSYLTLSEGPLGRLLYSQVAPMYLHLDVFGDHIPFLKGQSLHSYILSAFGYEQIRSAGLLMSHIYPERVEQGIAGVLNTLYIGEAYANFGYYGVAFGVIYVALCIQAIYILFIRLPKHPVFIALFSYFTVNIPRTLVGGFIDFFLNPIWVILFVLAFSFYIWIKQGWGLKFFLRGLNKRQAD